MLIMAFFVKNLNVNMSGHCHTFEAGQEEKGDDDDSFLMFTRRVECSFI